MSMYLPPIGAVPDAPVGMSAPGGQNATSKEYAAAFSSVFLQGMLKEIFKNQWKNDMLDDNINNSLYSDMLTDEMIRQLAESDVFGLNRLVEESIAKEAKMSGGDLRGM